MPCSYPCHTDTYGYTHAYVHITSKKPLRISVNFLCSSNFLLPTLVSKYVSIFYFLCLWLCWVSAFEGSYTVHDCRNVIPNTQIPSDIWTSFIPSYVLDFMVIWGMCCQKQVSQAGISNYIPQFTVGCNYLSLPEIPASGNKVHICPIMCIFK